ncbi:hypothetical protein Efla_004347 [Eimeria flavescens]
MDYSAREALGAPLSESASHGERRDTSSPHSSVSRLSSQVSVRVAPHQSHSTPGPGVPCSHQGPLGEGGLDSPLLPDAGGHSRSCFICLEGPRKGRRGAPPKLLHPCCSQCYAVVHEKCWTAYRRRQRLATFRARLLGHRAPDVAKCSICRTGEAASHPLPAASVKATTPQPTGEGASALQEQLLATLGRLLMDEGDVAGQPVCSGLCVCVNAIVLLAVFLVGTLLVALTDLQGVTVFLVSLFFYYHFVVFQLVYLAARQRREILAALPPAPGPPPDEAAGPAAPPTGPPPSSSQGGSHASSEGSRGGPPASSSSSSSRTRGVAREPLPLPSAAPQVTRGEETLMEAPQQRRLNGWFSFFRRGPLGPTDTLAESAGAPFLPDAAVAVEMQVLPSGSVRS